ncbi:MAG: amino acid synthesis family protein, partial [Desulfobacterales bacterium]|nr:amino acid synthesis family protein [Desulfobacterales bacterium]
MSEKPQIRKIYTVVEETHADGTVRINTPTRKAAAAVVFVNPFAGEYQEDLSLLIQWSEELGAMLTQKAVAVLGIEPDTVHSYGKGAIVGGKGELEHCAAIMHPALGKPMRDNVGGGKALIPSAKKRGYPGVAIDIPLGHK